MAEKNLSIPKDLLDFLLKEAASFFAKEQFDKEFSNVDWSSRSSAARAWRKFNSMLSVCSRSPFPGLRDKFERIRKILDENGLVFDGRSMKKKM